MTTLIDLHPPAHCLGGQNGQYCIITREDYGVSHNIRGFLTAEKQESLKKAVLRNLYNFREKLKQIPFGDIKPDQPSTNEKLTSDKKAKNSPQLDTRILRKSQLDAITRTMKIFVIADITDKAPTQETEITEKENIDLILKAMKYFTKVQQDSELFKLVSQPTITFPEGYLDEKKANGEMEHIAQAVCLTNKSAAQQIAQHLHSSQREEIISKITTKQNQIRHTDPGSNEQLDNLRVIRESLEAIQSSQYDHTRPLTGSGAAASTFTFVHTARDNVQEPVQNSEAHEENPSPN